MTLLRLSTKYIDTFTKSPHNNGDKNHSYLINIIQEYEKYIN